MSSEHCHFNCRQLPAVFSVVFLEITQFDSYTYDGEGSIGLRVPWICTDHLDALLTTKDPGSACKLCLLVIKQ